MCVDSVSDNKVVDAVSVMHTIKSRSQLQSEQSELYVVMTGKAVVVVVANGGGGGDSGARNGCAMDALVSCPMSRKPDRLQRRPQRVCVCVFRQHAVCCAQIGYRPQTAR